ncbi:MAG: hypothetical protein QXV17_07660 [Candidatus Micrarchaeaceae archaeon]
MRNKIERNESYTKMNVMICTSTALKHPDPQWKTVREQHYGFQKVYPVQKHNFIKQLTKKLITF